MDRQTGKNVSGIWRWFDQEYFHPSFDNNSVARFSTIGVGGNGVPLAYPGSPGNVSGSDTYYVQPSDVQSADDFIYQFEQPHTYVNRVQLHTNITASDYFHNDLGYGLRDGGLHFAGKMEYLIDSTSFPGFTTYVNHWINPLPIPSRWTRDVTMDETIPAYYNQGLIGPGTGILENLQIPFDIERRSSNTDSQQGSSLNRVVPSDLPSPYDPQNPQIGTLHTEYLDTDMHPSAHINTNPVNLGGLNGYTIPYERIELPDGSYIDDVQNPHSPVNQLLMKIDANMRSKVYKFRLVTTIRIA